MLVFIILFIIVIILLVIFISSVKHDVKYVKSYIDNREYLVLDKHDSIQAANTLARIRQNMIEISQMLDKHKNDKYKEYKNYIERLNKKIGYTKINEGGNDGSYTSYSVNKGDQLVFCLRSKKYKDILHDVNLVMYVVLHEMSHIACPEYGHTTLFYKIFRFITQVAMDMGKYQKINFNKNPTEYCGLIITDSIV